MTTPDTQQKHASHALALAGLIILAAMIALGFVHHSLPGIFWQVIAIGGTITFSVINFKNDFVKNEPWKSYAQLAMIFAVVTIYWIALSPTIK